MRTAQFWGNMSVLSPIRIGPLVASGPAVLAPLSGITDLPFRQIAERFGAGLVVSEMVATAALSCGHAEMIRKLGATTILPHIVQLAGNEHKWMDKAARIAKDAGAEVIDINLGCPSKRVTNGFAGCALMQKPDFAISLIETVMTATDLPVTVKMRLGWSDDTLNAPKIAKRAAAAGVKMVTVHGRTRQQFYKGQARWEPIADVVAAVDVPVLANGDIVDINSARAALVQSKAQGVMIGRGAQGQPWIVGQISDLLMGRQPMETPRGHELAQIVADHYQAMLDHYGEALGIRIARKHIGWYIDANLHADDGVLRKKLMTENSPQQVLSWIEQIFASNESKAA